MLKSSFRFISLLTKRTPIITHNIQYPALTQKLVYFCKTQKHQSNVHGHKHEHHHHKHHKAEESHENQHHQDLKQKQQHSHEGQHHKHEHQHEHKYGGGKHGHDHHAAHHTKLNKMTFEQLVQLKTQESMKLAHHKYEHQVRRLKELKEQKEHIIKNIKFFEHKEEQIKEKQQLLAQNIKTFEQDAELSKKRAEKQIEQSKNFAVTKVAKELLEVADCIANCKKYADQVQNKDLYIQQVIKTQSLLKDILKKFDIEQFDPTNEEYDPNSQQSLLQIPTPAGCKPNHVAMTMRTGYTIKGRLLRSARVGIFS